MWGQTSSKDFLQLTLLPTACRITEVTSPAPGLGRLPGSGSTTRVELRLEGRQTAPGVRGVLFEGGSELRQLLED
jgi:hypothetical protein